MRQYNHFVCMCLLKKESLLVHLEGKLIQPALAKKSWTHALLQVSGQSMYIASHDMHHM